MKQTEAVLESWKSRVITSEIWRVSVTLTFSKLETPPVGYIIHFLHSRKKTRGCYSYFSKLDTKLFYWPSHSTYWFDLEQLISVSPPPSDNTFPGTSRLGTSGTVHGGIFRLSSGASGPLSLCTGETDWTALLTCGGQPAVDSCYVSEN